MTTNVTKAIIVAGVASAITLVGFIICWVAFMHTETVEPGQHGVIVDKPYFWGHEGVRRDALKEGRILLWRTSSVTPVVMTAVSTHVKFDDFSSADNILLDFETTIQYQVIDPVELLDHFGAAWFDNNVARQYAAIVREAVKKKTMSAMMSDVNAAHEVDKEVTDELRKLVAESKLPVKIIGVSLGRAKPNENVQIQINETAAQQQRQKTLVAATAAEGDREKEQIAKAKADNAYRNAMGLSPEMFIQLEQIKRFAAACEKAGNVCVIGSSSNPVNVNAHK